MHNTTILIVEDESIVAADLAGKLGQLGYEVVGTAERGEEAIEMACRLKPEVVLMDIRLKGAMDGIEAAEEIHRRVDLPVIFLTAHSDAATLERAKLSDPFGYILKPFEERELSTTIEMALHKYQTDRQLREQLEWLRVTLTSIGDAVITCDTYGRVTFLNPVAEALSAWSIEEALDRSIQEVFRLINAQNGQPTEDPVALVLREGRPKALTNHTALITRDGREIPIEDSAAPILDADGRVIGVVLVFHDVTEKRRTQDALQESEARLQAANDDLQNAYEKLQAQAEELQSQAEELHAQNHELTLLWKESKRTRDELDASQERLQLALNSSGMATFDWDIVNNLRTWDDNVHRLLGTNPVTFTGAAEDFFRAMHPDDRSTVQLALSRAIATNGEYETEYRAVWPDGTIRHIAARGKVHHDSAGRAVRMTGICWDITERKHMDNQLRESEERLKRSQEIAHLGSWELDLAKNELIWSDEVYRIFGLQPQEFDATYEAFLEAVHPDDRVAVDAAYSSSLREGKDTYEIEHRIIRKSMGEIRVVHEKCEHYRDASGRIIRSVGMIHDITDRKRAKKELLQAKEAAEAASRAKSQFLANMSHELRTPMTGVLGMLDIVLLGNMEAEQRESIETAQTAARSLVRILNDILDITKIEAGKFSIEEKPFSIRKCLENTINILLPAAKGKGLALELTLADDLPQTLVGDQARLNQVLTNLAGNAVKFTEKGRVELHVAAGGIAAGGKREVSFTVSDTGIGIPDDKQELLFRNFSQVDESHTRCYGGTGLGLAISKEIVERMGGAIVFTSEEGKGSVFSITIPFAEAEAGLTAISVSGKTMSSGHTPPPEVTTNPRLLVAEDDQTIIQVLGTMLKMAKYEVDFAENGNKVVEMWENGSYDLILMDIQMPAMNGFEATAAIREKERSNGDHIPIIAMTAHALKEDQQRCLDAGMDAYVSKPIDFMECLQLIEDNLRI